MSTADIEITEGAGIPIAAHTISEDSETKYIERIAVGSGAIALPTTAQIETETVAGTYPSSSIDVQGKGRIVIKSSFSVNTDTCVYYLQFYDINDVLIGESDDYYEIANSGILDSFSRYVGTMVVINNEFGFCGIKIRLSSIPASGNVSFYVAGV